MVVVVVVVRGGAVSKIRQVNLYMNGQALNKKEHKNGGCSPDSPGEDIDATDYTLTPRTEAKYNKIDEDFQMMMQRTQHMNGAQRVTF